MKKGLLILILTALLMTSLVGVAGADNISVYTDGKKLAFDVPPTIEDGVTLVPLRAIFEALGADVKWFSSSQTIIATKSGKTVILKIGDINSYVNNKLNRLEVPARIIDGRTLVPLRFVSEALGAEVKWYGTTKTIIITLAGSGQTPETGNKDMAVHFIDVGQGDSILIITPNGKVMLIDGGPSTAGSKLVSYLKKAGVKSIDVLVLTHPHEDHIGGLINVLNSFPVKKVYESGYPDTSQTYKKFLNLIDQKDIDYNIAHAFNNIPLDSAITITTLNPGTTMSDINNNSIVLKVQYGLISFLLAGDAELAAEKYIMDRTTSSTLKSTIFKVGNHGSSTSTSQEFLNKVDPQIAIISVGEENDEGYPTSGIIKKLTNAGAKVYRTDLNGNIVIKTDGKTAQLTAAKSTPAPQPTPQPTKNQVRITNIDLVAETVTIKNFGSTAVNLKNWVLVSTDEHQTYVFPDFTLRPGATVTVTSGRNAVDLPPNYLKWSDNYIWNNNGDSGILYDHNYKIISQYQ